MAKRWVLAVGFFLSVGQFGLLFVGIHAGMPAGLSSLVLQLQAVFTIVLAVVVLGEQPTRAQLVGTTVALGGLALITAERVRPARVGEPRRPRPLAGLSLAVEGPGAIANALSAVGWPGLLSLLYIVVVATLFGWGAWTWLLARHPASSVAPFALLAPVAALVSTWLVRRATTLRRRSTSQGADRAMLVAEARGTTPRPTPREAGVRRRTSGSIPA